MEMLVMEQVKLGMEKRGFRTAVDPQCDIRVCPQFLEHDRIGHVTTNAHDHSC